MDEARPQERFPAKLYIATNHDEPPIELPDELRAMIEKRFQFKLDATAHVEFILGLAAAEIPGAKEVWQAIQERERVWLVLTATSIPPSPV